MRVKKSIFKKSFSSSFGAVTAAVAGTALVAAVVLYGVGQAEMHGASEGRKILENGLRRAVVTCYATEGVYPESLSYISENYGIHIDEKYTVFYDVKGSNIFPEITVPDVEE